MNSALEAFVLEAGDGDAIVSELRSLMELRRGRSAAGAAISGVPSVELPGGPADEDEDLRQAISVNCTVLVGESASCFRVDPGSADLEQSLSAYRKLRAGYPRLLEALGHAALGGYAHLVVTVGQGGRALPLPATAHLSVRAMPRILAMMRGQQGFPEA